MGTFLLVLALVIIIVVGNALPLLRSAKKPNIPPSVKPQPYDRDDSGGW